MARLILPLSSRVNKREHLTKLVNWLRSKLSSPICFVLRLFAKTFLSAIYMEIPKMSLAAEKSRTEKKDRSEK